MATNKSNKKDPFADLPSIQIPKTQEPSASAGDPFESIPTVESSQAPKKVSEISPLVSAGLGGLQGASLGFADEIEAAIRSGALSGPQYSGLRDKIRQRYSQAKEANPKSSFAGEVGGGLITSMIPGGALAKTAALGAATGLGSSEADLTEGDLTGAARDTAIGGTTGAVAGYLGSKLGKMLTPEAMESGASIKALKALGIKPNMGKKIPGVEASIGSNIDVGKTVLEQKALPIMGGSKGIQSALESKNEEALDFTKPILQRASQRMAASPGLAGETPALSNKMYTTLQKEISNLPKTGEMITLGETIEKNINPWLYEIAQAGNDPMKLDTAKKGLYKTIEHLKKNAYDNPDSGIKIGVYKKLANSLKNDIEGLVGKASGIGDQEALSQANLNVSNLIKAQGAAKKLVTDDIEEVPGSIIESLKPEKLLKRPSLAVTGLTSIVSAPLAVGGLATKIAAEKITGQPIGRLGNILGARGQYATGKALATPAGQSTLEATKKIGQSGVQAGIHNIYNQSPEKLRAIADDFSQTDGTKNLGEALTKALEADNTQSRDSVLFAIEQNPNTRLRLKQLLSEEDEGF